MIRVETTAIGVFSPDPLGPSELEVSKRIREESENAQDNYAVNDIRILIPKGSILRPAPEVITWHNENVYRG